jgi:hypothetical protein
LGSDPDKSYSSVKENARAVDAARRIVAAADIHTYDDYADAMSLVGV